MRGTARVDWIAAILSQVCKYVGLDVVLVAFEVGIGHGRLFGVADHFRIHFEDGHVQLVLCTK